MADPGNTKGYRMKTTLLKYFKKGVVEAGCDEAGRGSLAGPVFAAAVILSPGYENPVLNDSKTLTEKQRETLRREIEANARAWAVASATPGEIDRMNILNAAFLAMNRAILKLKITPQHLLIDGNRFRPLSSIPFTCMIKGDGRFYSIAAASVLAKTWRDEYMKKIHKKCRWYGWDRNKGYATKEHRRAIAEQGFSKYHRRSFRIRDEQLLLDFEPDKPAGLPENR